jgi:guanylate kinase
MKKFIVLSGPSGVGKTPLLKALRRVYPELSFGTLVLYISRKPRPGERDGVDFHFRTEQEIRALPPERFLVAKGRVVWQAIDLEEARRVLESSSLVIVEIYPTLGKMLMSHPRVRDFMQGFELRTVFLSPLHPEELDSLARSFPSRQEALAAVMLHKLVQRSLQQGKLITLEELDDLRARALKASEEMELASDYTDIIVNHDGEDSANWRFTPPLGDAGRALRTFAEIIMG